MPFELRVDPDEFLARARGWGNDDFAATFAAIKTLSEDPRLAAGMPVLLDVRELDYLATPPEVSSFAAPGSIPTFFAGHRVALLTKRGAQFGVARSFTAKAEMAGSDMEVFVEPDRALAWLAGRT